MPRPTRTKERSAREHDEARGVLRAILEDLARDCSRTTYAEIAEKANDRVPGLHLYATNKELWHLLSQIAEEDVAAGRPMLPVLVVHKTADHEPGPGFFDLARRLGRLRSGQEVEEFLEAETHAVFTRWGCARAR